MITFSYNFALTPSLVGEVSEVIVYNRSLTPAERTRVETYLAQKYARNLVQSDFRYTGHYHHERSGLTLAPYRAYDANLGRWLSRDPMGESDGPNLYAYVGNNPTNMFDPNGLWGIGFYNSNLSSGFNIGVGDPSLVFTPDSAQDVGHGAQATVDGLLPFSDPFAELGEMFPDLDTYDPCENGFSKGAGQFAYGAIAAGAALQYFAPQWANAAIGWKGGEITLTKPGSPTPDIRINPTGGSGYPPHYHRRPGIGKHRPWQGW